MIRAGALLAVLSACAYARAPTVTLNNGVEFPMISLGTGGYNSSVAQHAVGLALGLDWTSVDTALDYGNQPGVAGAIASSGFKRSDVFILTKVPGCGDTPVSQTKCFETTLAALQTNLQQLNTRFVDVALLHFPPTGPVRGCSTEAACGMIQEQWRAMEAFYAAGSAKAIGVSNYCVSCFKCLAKTGNIVPAVNQIQYHVGMGPGPTKSLIAYCASKGIVIQAYAPLGGSSSVHPNDPYPLIHNNLTASIGQRYGKSSVQIALRWILQQGLPLITKSGRADYMHEDLNVFDFVLSREDMATLDSTDIDPDDPTRNACS